MTQNLSFDVLLVFKIYNSWWSRSKYNDSFISDNKFVKLYYGNLFFVSDTFFFYRYDIIVNFTATLKYIIIKSFYYC